MTLWRVFCLMIALLLISLSALYDYMSHPKTVYGLRQIGFKLSAKQSVFRSPYTAWWETEATF